MKRREFVCTLVQAGLGTTLVGVSPALWAGKVSRTIRGRVTGDGEPLGDVLMSDGCRVTRTNPRGEYELEVGPDSGRFVFVTTPRGWWTERFYVPTSQTLTTGRADFELCPIDQPDRFDFVFITDMHIEKHPWSVGKLKESLREINQLTPTPAFVLAQGDICLQVGDKVGRAYVDSLMEARMPVRNGAGNHDVFSGHQNPRDAFEQLFGPTYYSFDWGPLHVIVLDGNKVRPGRQGRGAVHGTVEGSEWAWLQADLVAQPKQKPVVVGVHIPIVSTYPVRHGGNPEDLPFWEIPNQEPLTDLFARHQIKLVLQGHDHENERITLQGVEYVASAAIAGGWWKSPDSTGRRVNPCPDGCPRGYRVVSVDGQKITHHYRSSCESHVDWQGEFVGLADQVQADKETPLVFNCYDAPNGSTAEARIDGGPWQRMAALRATLRRGSPLVEKPHHFRMVVQPSAFSPGRHSIEVRVTWPDGIVVTERKTVTVLRQPITT